MAIAENLNIEIRNEQDLPPRTELKAEQSFAEDKIGPSTIEQMKLRLKELEKVLMMCKNNPHTRDDIETIKWLEIEIKIWQRRAEGKRPEGETKEEKDAYRIHVNKEN